MKVFTESAELTRTLSRTDGRTGFVPTMGALHDGHISLVDRCRRECDSVVVSLFVNPTQFNDPRDLQSYPRTPEADLVLLEKAGADFVLAPSVEDIYPEKDTRRFDFGRLDKVMEGAHRPGHFNGVAQVVSRLFDIVRPDRAYFGEKDFQQIAVVRAMARQLGYAVEIVPCPIVRGSDGLALSSRNALLPTEYRAAAPEIYAALAEGAALARKVSVAEMKKQVMDRIDSNPLLRVEYLSVVDADTLEETSEWGGSPMRACIAVQAGPVRLIDNVAVG